MNRFGKLMTLVILAAAFALLAVPVLGQGEGEGGVIIEGTFGGDPATLNPFLSSDTTSQDLVNFMYPGLLGVDPSQALIVPRLETAPEFQGGYLVDSWEVSDDGLVYTFKMREDYTWSDGVPVTTADVAYAWEAIQAAEQGLNDAQAVFITEFITDVSVIDDYTFTVTFTQPTCTALNYAGSLGSPLAPSHALGPVDQLNDDPFNLEPTVFGGVFRFGSLNAGQQTALIANTEYPDGDVIPSGYILRNTPDQNVLVEQFLAGETNVIREPAVARRAEVRTFGDEGNATVYSYPGSAWDYMAFNLADPNNPQPALDDAGERVDQGVHPIFSDKRVRQAIGYAVDVNALIEAAVFNEGSRMTSYLIPSSWAYNNDLAPRALDLDAAAALLEEAGWVDDDNDPSTPRVAQGAMYAEDGAPLSFTLFTNEGNTRRTAIGTVIQDQLSQIGIQVDFQTIDFNVLVDVLQQQTFDAVILGWRNGYPDDPDATQLFTSAGDIPGSGSNFTSFYNERFEELNAAANDATQTNGCDPDARAEYYYEAQEIMLDEMPYLWLFTQDGMYAAASTVSGFSPYPAQPYWNINTWSVATP